MAKVYLAKIQGKVGPETLQTLTRGIFSDGDKLRARRARLVRSGKNSSVVELELAEGKNREVRRMFESQRLTVRRLQRVQIGPIKLGQLPVGKWRTLSDAEVKSLLSSI
jgi:pseudouridine synthase